MIIISIHPGNPTIGDLKLIVQFDFQVLGEPTGIVVEDCLGISKRLQQRVHLK